MGNRELVALLNLSSWCLVMVERLFLAVPRGCLRFVIVVFPHHTHLLFLIARGEILLADVICNWKMTSFTALDGVTSFLHMKDIANTRKRMGRSLSIGGSSSVQWRKVGRS